MGELGDHRRGRFVHSARPVRSCRTAPSIRRVIGGALESAREHPLHETVSPKSSERTEEGRRRERYTTRQMNAGANEVTASLYCSVKDTRRCSWVTLP